MYLLWELDGISLEQPEGRRALFSRVLPHVSVPHAVTPNETTTSWASWVQPSCTMFDWCSTSEHCFPFVLPGLCDFMQTCSFVLLPSCRTTFAEYYELLLRKLGGHPIWYCFPLLSVYTSEITAKLPNVVFRSLHAEHFPTVNIHSFQELVTVLAS